MTAIHPVNATVEQVSEVEPFARYILRGRRGRMAHLLVERNNREAAYEAANSYSVSGWTVQIIDTRPETAPSPASAEIDQLLVDLREKIAAPAMQAEERRRIYDALDALSEKLGRVTR